MSATLIPTRRGPAYHSGTDKASAPAGGAGQSGAGIVPPSPGREQLLDRGPSGCAGEGASAGLVLCVVA